MIAQKAFEDTKKLLKKHNQSHLLVFSGQLDKAERQNLLAQIRQLDLAKIADWVANFVKTPISTEISTELYQL